MYGAECEKFISSNCVKCYTELYLVQLLFIDNVIVPYKSFTTMCPK